MNFLLNAQKATQSIEGLTSCGRGNEMSAENEHGGTDESQTSKAMKYTIRIGHANFTIIDTPGFGDTRGTDWDARNFEEIK